MKKKDKTDNPQSFESIYANTRDEWPETEETKQNEGAKGDKCYAVEYYGFTEVIKKILNISEDIGVAGCTYGDTRFDSESAAYGYNLCLENIKNIITKNITTYEMDFSK